MRKKVKILILGFCFCWQDLAAQHSRTDTLIADTLKPVIVIPHAVYTPSYDVSGSYLLAGKKREMLYLKESALSEKYARQLFAKVPGLFVYDMDGTGNQINIAVRGLDAHRGWEFNIRKDGILTNSDMYGYPASHYNLPMEAVERIELVRGTASLQYGAQFGGQLNYITKAPESKPFTLSNTSTVGSFGLLSTHIAASGTLKKFAYSAWLNRKRSTGYRQNSDSHYEAEGLSFFYKPSENLQIKAEWTRSNYVIHLAGPQVDSLFKANPKSSTRSRNYYNPNIHLPSVAVTWQPSAKSFVEFKSSAVLGQRNSVLFDRAANIADTIVTATGAYNHRQVDIDNFNSYTQELRWRQRYKLLGQISHFVVGLQRMDNDLHRRQQGKGTTGSDFDLSLVADGWGRDLHFKTQNTALFVENALALSSKWQVNMGFRGEWGQSVLSGQTVYLADSAIANKIKHHFPLFGASTTYNFTPKISLYAGWAQAYRPVILKDIVPASIYERSDPNLKDAYGYNAELGFKGSWKNFVWDITGFYIDYNRRLGTIAQQDSLGNLLVYRTNIGDSRTLGIEFFAQANFDLGNQFSLSLFNASAYIDARYQNATFRSGNQNIDVSGNKVESTPAWTSRTGLKLMHKKLTFFVLYSYTAESFADALNTLEPSASGATGLVPAYSLLDVQLAYQVSEKIRLQANLNNALNAYYFTKRPQFYPGPGIWASDGRGFSLSLAWQL